jgi:hypothetical protein
VAQNRKKHDSTIKIWDEELSEFQRVYRWTFGLNISKDEARNKIIEIVHKTLHDQNISLETRYAKQITCESLLDNISHIIYHLDCSCGKHCMAGYDYGN